MMFLVDITNKISYNELEKIEKRSIRFGGKDI